MIQCCSGVGRGCGDDGGGKDGIGCCGDLGGDWAGRLGCEGDDWGEEGIDERHVAWEIDRSENLSSMGEMVEDGIKRHEE